MGCSTVANLGVRMDHNQMLDKVEAEGLLTEGSAIEEDGVSWSGSDDEVEATTDDEAGDGEELDSDADATFVADDDIRPDVSKEKLSDPPSYRIKKSQLVNCISDRADIHASHP